MVTNMKCRMLSTACLLAVALWLPPLSAQEADPGSAPALAQTSGQQPEQASAESSDDYPDSKQSKSEQSAITSKPNTESTAPLTQTDSDKKYSSFGSSSNKTPAPGSGLVAADPVTVIAGLLLVVALIFVVAWLMKRIGAVPVMPGQTMKILSALSVGTREKVLLIEVGDKQLLLGVAPGRVSHLQTFDEVVVSAPSQSNDFAATIKKFLQPHVTDEQKASRQEDEK